VGEECCFGVVGVVGFNKRRFLETDVNDREGFNNVIRKSNKRGHSPCWKERVFVMVMVS
jgi:hypothetical protein